MERSDDSPGVALVLLRRLATTTDVMLVAPGRDGTPLPWAAPRGDASQRSLLEDLIRTSQAGEVDRLYASTLAVPGSDGPLGVFVAFVEDTASVPPAGMWIDLREACRGLAPVWSAALLAVRESFVARSPDEALRIR